MSDFAEDPHLRTAVALWCDYYAATDAFDARVCTGPMGRDGRLPNGEWQTAAVAKNAVLEHRRLMGRAAGIDPRTMQRAKEIALRSRPSVTS